MTKLPDNPTLSMEAIDNALKGKDSITQFILVISEKLIDVADKLQEANNNLFIYRVFKDWKVAEWQINDCGNTEVYFSKGDESGNKIDEENEDEPEEE